MKNNSLLFSKHTSRKSIYNIDKNKKDKYKLLVRTEQIGGRESMTYTASTIAVINFGHFPLRLRVDNTIQTFGYTL